MFKKVKHFFWAIPAFLAIVLIGGFVWLATPVGASMPQAIDALQSDAVVEISTEQYLVFSPTDQDPSVGFIFYPGAKVPAEAYAPTAYAIAEAG